MVAHSPLLETIAMHLTKMMCELVLVCVSFFATKVAKEWLFVWEFCLVERNETEPVDCVIPFTHFFMPMQLLEITDEFVAGTALHIMSLQSISELESCDILLADVGIAKNSEQVLLVSIVA